MIRISHIMDAHIENHPDGDIELVKRAYVYSAKVHAGQMRLSGEPYLSHPLEVAYIVAADMRLDSVSIAAALLHDVVEDTHTTIEVVEEMFGKHVAHIVDGLTKLSKVHAKSAQERHAESIRKMILAMADDIRVILIKLADRLHNMRTLKYHRKEEKKQSISQETLDIYASIASRLGIYWMKRELEDTAFYYVNPAAYNRIKGLVDKEQEEREDFVGTVKRMIRSELEKEKLPGEVLGRYKHFYSIYQKMIQQNLEFEDVYDIIAFRIIVETKPQCYEALGVIHNLWKPIDIKFKDYIARPKPNMYQSLHTTVIGPFGERVEIQIRTHEMDRIAKSGIAAHWSYKEGKVIDENISQRFEWIKNLIDNQAGIRDPEEFLESVRIDLFPEEVSVFTPKGEIKSLVRGATPVDFAYMIHTEVGNQCMGAKVNGRIVPLRYELQTGDVVDIITSKSHHPSEDWLSFVKTAKARARIRQWIRAQEKERSISLGREMCEKEFRKHRLSFVDLMKTDEMGQVVADFGYKSLDDLLANVGFGKVTPLQLIRRYQKQVPEQHSPTMLERLIRRVRKRPVRGGVTVTGMDDILVRFGKCCQPVPGDPILGYITQGQGVTIHRVNCVHAQTLNPERRIEVAWTEDESKDTFPVKIHVRSYDRVGLLADLAANISKNGANILNVSSQIREDNTVDSFFTLAVRNTHHLDTILSAMRKVKPITKVQRIEG